MLSVKEWMNAMQKLMGFSGIYRNMHKLWKKEELFSCQRKMICIYYSAKFSKLLSKDAIKYQQTKRTAG